MADVFDLSQQIIYAEEFGKENYKFFQDNIDLGVGSWMNDLSPLIDENCRKAITCALDDSKKVIEVVRYLVKQNDIEKYKMFIDIWKKHAPAKATQFETALLKRIEDQNAINSNPNSYLKRTECENSIKPNSYLKRTECENSIKPNSYLKRTECENSIKPNSYLKRTECENSIKSSSKPKPLLKVIADQYSNPLLVIIENQNPINPKPLLNKIDVQNQFSLYSLYQGLPKGVFITYYKGVFITYYKGVFITYNKGVFITYNKGVFLTYNKGVFITYNKGVFITYNNYAFW